MNDTTRNTLFQNWPESDQNIFKEWLKGTLTDGVVVVTFLKKDGTERKMSCTLNSNLVVLQERKTDREITPSLETCKVFDLEKQEWRSFRYDSILSVGISLK